MMDERGTNSGAVLKNFSDFSWLPPGQQRMMLNVIARVEMLVETVVNLCVRVLRLDGLSIETIMSANFDRSGTTLFLIAFNLCLLSPWLHAFSL